MKDLKHGQKLHLKFSRKMKYRFYRSPHPYLCFASCLRTIIEGYCDVVLDEFIIGSELGVTLPDDREENLFEVFSRSHLSTDWGVNADTDKINSLLVKYKAPITCKFISAKIFEDYSFEDFVMSSIVKDSLVIFGFDYNSLFNMSSKDIVGHAAVGISAINNGGDVRINIYDPGPLLSGQKQVTAFDMYVACKRKGGGIWVFEH